MQFSFKSKTLNCFGWVNRKWRDNVLVAFCMSVAFLLLSCGGSNWTRSTLDKYVELETEQDGKLLALNPGLSIYVDFSDGMNAAYATPLSKSALSKVINVFTDAENKVKFYSLAADEITPLDLPQTQIYNAIMNPKNYDKPRAPIQKTLETIVKNKQAALLITDFEEYNGGQIQMQNYAKSYFINWLKEGFNIVFYKIDYQEGNKPKHLYFTVFDAPDFQLSQKVEEAVEIFRKQGMDRFVLGSPKCAFPVQTTYLSSTQGGNYHNSQGKDVVTGVVEDGTSEAYIAYPATKGSGIPIQYYPLGDKWENIISNISAMQEAGVPKEDTYKHLFSKMYVDFDCQDGYSIEEVSTHVIDFQKAMDDFSLNMEQSAEEGKVLQLPKEKYEGVTVNDFMIANMSPANNPSLVGKGWKEITIDLDPRFNGTIPASMDKPEDLLKINIVISKAKPRLEKISEFFSWPGNTSLSESVENALQSKEVNPSGRVLATYYLKVI